MNKKISKIAEQIIMIRVSEEIQDDILDVFYELMRKNNIAYGTKEGDGITGANFEWTMCKTLFIQNLVSNLELRSCFYIPEDLKCYEE